MAYYQTVSYTDTGTKASLALDPSIASFNATVGVFLSSTGTYGLQFSLDPLDTSDAASDWLSDLILPTGTTVSGFQAYNMPITKVRIVIAANGGTIKLKVLQGFTGN